MTPHVYSATESGGALAWLATAPELAGTTGQYFSGRTAIRSSDESYDTVRADDLWNDSLSLTSVRA